MEITEREYAILESLSVHVGQVKRADLWRNFESRLEGDSALLLKERRHRYNLAFESLVQKGLVSVTPVSVEIKLTERGQAAVTTSDLPLRELLKTLSTAGPLAEAALPGGDSEEEQVGLQLDIKYALDRSWIEHTPGGEWALTPKGTYLLGKPDQTNELHTLWQVLCWVKDTTQNGSVLVGKLTGRDGSRQRQFLHYLEALGLLRLSSLEDVVLTPEGLDILTQEPTVLTVQNLRSQVYLTENLHLSLVDPLKPVSPTLPGKSSQATTLLKSVRQYFIQLGFEEQPLLPAELAFWNFDMLLFPSEHPERSASHVYYLDETHLILQPPYEFVQKYRMLVARHDLRAPDHPDSQRLLRPMLRTHVTPAMISLLARSVKQDSDSEFRSFAIGRVYSPAHIGGNVLHAEGLIFEKDASMFQLVGVIRELLGRLYPSRISHYRFQNTSYPYTAPSMIVVDTKINRWVAAGGMIRPEILEALDINMDHYLAAAFSLFFQLNFEDGEIIFGRPMPGE